MLNLFFQGVEKGKTGKVNETRSSRVTAEIVKIDQLRNSFSFSSRLL